MFLWRRKIFTCVIFNLEHERDMPFVSISMFLTIIDVPSRVRFPIVFFKVTFALYDLTVVIFKTLRLKASHGVAAT